MPPEPVKYDQLTSTVFPNARYRELPIFHGLREQIHLAAPVPRMFCMEERKHLSAVGDLCNWLLRPAIFLATMPVIGKLFSIGYITTL